MLLAVLQHRLQSWCRSWCWSRFLLPLKIWPIVVAASIIAAIDTSKTVPDKLKNPSLLAGVMTCPRTGMLFNREQRMAQEQR